MSTTTPNLGLIKQTGSENYSIDVVNGNLDLIDAGTVGRLNTSGQFVYSHNGSTQGHISVINGTTAATIPIRDSNGRMQAADPASGATDKTLVTANWVSQTGAGRPNNLIHDGGNEDINGIKNMTGPRFRLTAGIPYIEAFGTSFTAGTPNQYEWFMQIRDVNGVEVGDLFFSTDRDGNSQLSVALRKADGTTVTRVLATSV